MSRAVQNGADAPQLRRDPRGAELLRQLDLARQSADSHAIARSEQAVVLHYLGLARAMARRFAGNGVDRDDMLQVARVGLVKAVRGWCPDKGDGLLQYAIPMVSGELRRYLRDHGTMIRVPRRIQQHRPAIVMAESELGADGQTVSDGRISDATGLTTTEVRAYRQAYDQVHTQSLDAPNPDGELPAAPSPSAERELELVEDRVELQRCMSQLTARERKLISLRFFHDRTQEQIGAVLGVSQMQVSRLLRSTLAKLRDGLGRGRTERIRGTSTLPHAG